MTGGRRSLGELVAMGVIAGLVAFGLALSTRPHGALRGARHSANVVETPAAAFELHAAASRLSVRSRDGAVQRDLDLALVVDGDARPLALDRGALRTTAEGWSATVPVALGDTTLEASLDLRSDAARDALSVDLVVPADPAAAGHTFAVRAELGSEGQVVFVPGVGQVADRGTVTGGALVVDADPHPIAVMSPAAPVSVDAILEEAAPGSEPMRVSATTMGAPASLRIVVGATSSAL
ncbi:MAG: hypothetical protein ACRELB_05655, partial [Polyangiaceae bacterium]